MLKITLNEKVILPEYFKFLLSSSNFQNLIIEQSRGSAMSNIAGMKHLRNIKFPVPSIDMQKSIINKLNTVEMCGKQIDDIQSFVQENIEYLPHSVLSKAFRGELVV